jgi:hypothetical protein
MHRGRHRPRPDEVRKVINVVPRGFPCAAKVRYLPRGGGRVRELHYGEVYAIPATRRIPHELRT